MKTYDQVVNELGLLTGKEAIVKSGIPSIFAKLLIEHQVALGGHPFALRTSSQPPVLNQTRSSKSGGTHTKSSEIGLERGCIAKDQRFLRIIRKSDGTIIVCKHDKRDVEKLKCEDPFNVGGYQHTKQLQIVYQDLIKEVMENGSYNVISYDKDNKQLFLQYKPGLGPITEQEQSEQLLALENRKSSSGYEDEKSRIENYVTFNGYVILSFRDLVETRMVYYREWDKPENLKNWDPEKKIIRKPDALINLPDEIYESLANKLIPVFFTEKKDIGCELVFKPLEVFVNTPGNIKSIAESLVSNADKVFTSGEKKIKNKFIRDATLLLAKKHKTYFKFDEKLKSLQINNNHLKKLFDMTGLFITSDWDALFLGYPYKSKLLSGKKYNSRYNTFSGSDSLTVNNADVTLADFHSNTKSLIKNLKLAAKFSLYAENNLYTSLKKMTMLEIEREILDPSAIKSAGCTSPYEFASQQLLNSAFRDAFHNISYKDKCEEVGLSLDEFNDILQYAFVKCFEIYKPIELEASAMIERSNMFKSLLVQEVQLNKQEKINGISSLVMLKKDAVDAIKNKICINIYSKIEQIFHFEDELIKKIKQFSLWELAFRHIENEFWKVVNSEHKSCIYKNGSIDMDEIPILAPLAFDRRLINLFQHGFDFSNPEGISASGGWLLAYQGKLVYGEGFDQLLQVFMSEGFLKNYFIEVNDKVDFLKYPCGIGWGDVVDKQLRHQFVDRSRPKLSFGVVVSYQKPRLEKINKKKIDKLDADDFDILYEILICCYEYGREFYRELADKRKGSKIPLSDNLLLALLKNLQQAQLIEVNNELEAVELGYLPTTIVTSLVYLFDLSEYILETSKATFNKEIKKEFLVLAELIINANDISISSNDNLFELCKSILNNEYSHRQEQFELIKKRDVGKSYYGLLNRSISNYEDIDVASKKGSDDLPFLGVDKFSKSFGSFSFGESSDRLFSRHSSILGVRDNRKRSSGSFYGMDKSSLSPPVLGSPVQLPLYNYKSSSSDNTGLELPKLTACSPRNSSG